MVTIEESETTKQLAAWAGIFAVATAFAGIWGMNFDHMPELHCTYGYPAALAAHHRHLRPALSTLQARRLAVMGYALGLGRIEVAPIDPLHLGPLVRVLQAAFEVIVRLAGSSPAAGRPGCLKMVMLVRQARLVLLLAHLRGLASARLGRGLVGSRSVGWHRAWSWCADGADCRPPMASIAPAWRAHL
jgi:hypothetical protein